MNLWYKTKTPESPEYSTLARVFRNATALGQDQFFFDDIWIPLRDRDTNHNMLDTYTYKNVGVSTFDMADMYWTLYSRNVLSVPFILPDVDADKYDKSVNELSVKIKSILNFNLYKYLKWIESMGYAYNPLWNVDGVESFQYIDTHGDVTRTDSPILQVSQELQTTPYDSNTYKNTEKTINNYGNTTQEQVTGLTAVNKETHASVTNDLIDGTVHAITGGDYSHIEKRIRQGNIGLTQTTALIESERELVKFNLIQEFFNDINKQLLVGIYI